MIKKQTLDSDQKRRSRNVVGTQTQGSQRAGAGPGAGGGAPPCTHCGNGVLSPASRVGSKAAATHSTLASGFTGRIAVCSRSRFDC